MKKFRKPNAQEEALKTTVRKLMQSDRCRLLEKHPFLHQNHNCNLYHNFDYDNQHYYMKFQ